MPSIYATAKEHRKALLARDEAARARQSEAYDAVLVRLERLSNDLTQQITEALAKGEDLSPSWLFRQERYRRLIQQTKAEIDRWATGVAPALAFEQQQAIALAGLHTAELLAINGITIGATFTQLPVAAIENLVGFAGNGSPLAALLNSYGKDAADQVKTALVTNLASGRGVAPATREIRRILEQPKWKAERLVRTELLRSYRESTRQGYEANGIKQYQWLCAKSRRTCAACLSLDGQVFEVDKPMPAHINCRCTVIPVFGTPRKWKTGAEWFAEQPEAYQVQRLGADGAAEYRAGRATLGDFVKLKKSAEWGDSYVQAGLAK